MFKKLKSVNYFYTVFPKQKIIFEYTDKDLAEGYAKSFGGYVWNHLPHTEYGFKDPYSFINEWIFIDAKGNTIKYTADTSGVKEVICDFI